MSASSIARWVGGTQTRASSRSTTAGCPKIICSAGEERAFGISCRSSTMAALRSQLSQSGSRRAAWTNRFATRASAKRSGGQRRALVLKAAWLKEEGRSYKKEAAMAKLFASEAAVEVARDAVQIHGGYGYIEEFPVCRHFRDSKILEIGEGTSEVMRMLIARELGLPPS